MNNYFLVLNMRKNVLLLGCWCALSNAITNALDNFTIHNLITAEDKITAAFAYLILLGWTGTIVVSILSVAIGKRTIDEDFTGIKVNSISMQFTAFLSGLTIALSSFFTMLAHQIGDPSVIAALSNLTIIYTLLYDVWKGQVKLNILLLPVMITIIGGMMSAFNGSLEITILGFFFVVVMSNGFRAFGEIIQQKGVRGRGSDSLNFFIWNFFWLAFTGTIIAFIVSAQRGYLSLLLETIVRGSLNLHWVILTMFFVFFGVGLKLYLKKSQAVSVVLVILSLNVVLSYPITFIGNWFQQGVFGQLPSNPIIWTIRIMGSFLIIWGIFKLNKQKQLIKNQKQLTTEDNFMDRNDKKKLILVVCWGNILRSPVAEALINKKLSNQKLDDKYYCLSRGIQGTNGVPAPKHPNLKGFADIYDTIKSKLRELGIEEVAEHISTPVDLDIIQQASIIFAMDQDVLTGRKEHPEAGLMNQFPEANNKIRLFTELIDEQSGIDDPYGAADASNYLSTINQIYQVLDRGFNQLISILEEK